MVAEPYCPFRTGLQQWVPIGQAIVIAKDEMKQSAQALSE
jgi:hypothetical protein